MGGEISSVEQILLIVAAVVPAIILGGYIFKKDRVEKEPIGLLLLVFGLGVASCIPTIFAEVFADGFIQGAMSEWVEVREDGVYAVNAIAWYVYQFLQAFFGVALIEEFFKWGAMRIATVKHREFDSLFDGVIYGAFSALGFATFENIFYVLENGWQTAALRAVLSVPGHLSYGIIMGCYYSFWQVARKAQTLEKNLKVQGKIPANAKEISCTKFNLLGILIPTAFHGAYDFCCFTGTGVTMLAMLAIVVFLYVYCFKKIRKMSKGDGAIKDYYIQLILKKYPNLTANIAPTDSEIVEEIIEITD